MVALGRSSCLEIWPGVSVAGPKARFACSRHATPAGTRGQQASAAEIAALRPATMQGQMKWRLLLPGASEPRLTELNPPGLQDGLSNCVTQPEQPEHSCRLQLLHSPITAEQYREKTRPLRPRRSCFAPAEAHLEVAVGRALVEAPGAAPGSEWFIATAIYFHSRRTGTPNIRCKDREGQGPRAGV